MAGKMTERELTIKVRHHEPVTNEEGCQSGSLHMTVMGGTGTIEGLGFRFGASLALDRLVIEFDDDKLEAWVVAVEDLLGPIFEARAKLKSGT